MASIPISYYISTNQVVNPKNYLGSSELSKVEYKDQLVILNHPLIPLLPLGLDFELDLVIALDNHPRWGMIEIFSVTLPGNKKTWLTLDSQLNGSQFIGLPQNFNELAKDTPIIFPATTYASNILVSEKNEKHMTSYHVRYQRIDGEQIDFKMEVPNTKDKPFWANGHTMNHSLMEAQIVLYLERIGFTYKNLKLNKGLSSVQKILGLIPMSLQLQQTVIGFMKGDWSQNDSELILNEINLKIEKEEDANKVSLKIKIFPEIIFHFLRNFEKLELKEIEIFQLQNKIGSIHFNPSLPDFRFQFDQQFESKVIINIKEKMGFYKGIIKGKREEFEILGIKPRWCTNRPIKVTLNDEKFQASRIERKD